MFLLAALNRILLLLLGYTTLGHVVSVSAAQYLAPKSTVHFSKFMRAVTLLWLIGWVCQQISSLRLRLFLSAFTSLCNTMQYVSFGFHARRGYRGSWCDLVMSLHMYYTRSIQPDSCVRHALSLQLSSCSIYGIVIPQVPMQGPLRHVSLNGYHDITRKTNSDVNITHLFKLWL